MITSAVSGCHWVNGCRFNCFIKLLNVAVVCIWRWSLILVSFLKLLSDSFLNLSNRLQGIVCVWCWKSSNVFRIDNRPATGFHRKFNVYLGWFQSVACRSYVRVRSWSKVFFARLIPLTYRHWSRRWTYLNIILTWCHFVGILYFFLYEWLSGLRLDGIFGLRVLNFNFLISCIGVCIWCRVYVLLPGLKFNSNSVLAWAALSCF